MKPAMLSGLVVGTAAYKAAYVEHIAVSPCGQGSCGKEQNAASVKSYASYAATAAQQGAQIIVFPEYGITGFSSYSKQSWHTGGYTEVFPAPSGIVPCDDANGFSGAPSVVSLSCTAKQHSIAIVANLMEYVGGKMYNTNVALDTDGTYLAKYHKRNLWGESNVDAGPAGEQVSFTTSFGATFGMLVCADLIYEHPVLDLVRAGVGNFVMPLAWSNEMGQMQALAYAQGWSAANGVNLILANHRSSSESGSGVLVSGYPASQTYAPSSRAGSVQVADVSAPAAGAPLAAPLSRFNLTKLSSSGWKYSRLSSGSQTCSGSTCCTVSVTSGSADGYVVAVLDGTDTNDGMTWPAQVCAVLPCSGSGSSACLNFQQPTGSLHGVEVQMSGLRDGLCVPEVLATNGNKGEALLAPGATSNGFEFSQQGSGSSVTATSDAALLSAILYSRPFGNDVLV